MCRKKTNTWIKKLFLVNIINSINSSKKKKIILKKKINTNSQKLLDLLIKIGYIKKYNKLLNFIYLNKKKKIKFIKKKNIKYKTLKHLCNLNITSIYLISTSFGLLTHLACLDKKIGGFLICKIYL